jgi:two-component system, NarL family, sensor histidine kinase UhpB
MGGRQMALRMGGSAEASPPGGTGPRSRARSRLSGQEARARSSDDEIRRLLARELHDRVAQTLTTMLIDLENFKADQVGREGVLRQMDNFQDSTRGVLNNLRELLYELRGGPGVEEGFVDALRLLIIRFQERSRIEAKLAVLPGWPTRVASPAAQNLYRIIEEALSNVRQHSGAKEVQIILQPHSEHELSVCVADDGRGLELDDPGPTGLGMVGMKERALFLGAQLRVQATAGSGTTVSVIVPREKI